MRATYPNLELLEYKATLGLLRNEEFVAAFEAVKEKNKWARVNLQADVFLQTWPDTATGFDENGVIVGHAFTDAYTTVFKETNTNDYVVCFGNEICYMIHNAKEKFFEDLSNRQMASRSEAKRLY